jgi:hypothetical protein
MPNSLPKKSSPALENNHCRGEVLLATQIAAMELARVDSMSVIGCKACCATPSHIVHEP